MKKITHLTEEKLRKAVEEACIEEGFPQGQSDIKDVAKVGFMEGHYEVYVRTDDSGNMPHVHITKTKEKSNGVIKHFETCVRLDTNAYFLHGEYTDVFDSEERKAFAEFMRSKPLKAKRYDTNYEWTIDLWNANNSNADIEPQYKVINGVNVVIIPDYENMV